MAERAKRAQRAQRGSAPRIPIEATAVVPAPGMTLPTFPSFSRDDAQLTYLLGTPTDPTQKVWRLETATGAIALLLDPPGGGVREEALSLSEPLRRQRERADEQAPTMARRAGRSTENTALGVPGAALDELGGRLAATTVAAVPHWSPFRFPGEDVAGSDDSSNLMASEHNP